MSIGALVKGRVRRSYLIVFGIILTLTSLSTFFVQRQLTFNQAEPELINLAGKQRTYSQRVALSVQSLFLATTPQEHAERLIMLETSLAALERQHVLVLQPTGNTLRTVPLSEKIRLLYFDGDDGLDGLMRRYIDLSKQYLQQDFENRGSLPVFNMELSDRLLNKLDAVVAALESDAKERSFLLVKINYGLWVGILITLACGVFWVFLPLEKLVIKSYERMRWAIKRASSSKREVFLANKTKSEFLTSMSHELRTPISTMFGLLELLGAEDKKAGRENLLKKAFSTSHQLLSLINNVLDISRIDRDELAYQNADFNLIELLDASIAPIAAACSDRGVLFSYESHNDMPEYVVGDSIHLSQALNAVLSNAIKFTGEGAIDINTYFYVNDSGYRFSMSVKDTSIGIAEHQVSKSLNQFNHVSQGKELRSSGTGIGLTIAKALVEGMGGVFTVHSVEGRGSTFLIEVPLAVSQLKIPANIRVENEKLIFALVDDLSTSRQYLSGLLRKEGYRVDEFASGTELLAQQKSAGQYAAIITDLHMPGLHGQEVAETLHAILGKETPPFIFISASAESVNNIKPSFADVWHAFVKPVEKNRFIDLIKLIGRQTSFVRDESKPVSILLVEDDEINAEIVGEMLRQMSHQVAFAKDGNEAVEQVRNKDFDMILMDINLPDISGLEATHIIREKLNKDVPVIALTGNAFEEDREKSMQAGMRYHLVKPVLHKELQNVIRVVVNEAVY